LDKAHGRLEQRDLWCVPVSPADLGLAGAAQVLRIERLTQKIRRGKVVKESRESAFAFTSLWPEEAAPPRLLEVVRSHWNVENGQHHRRDRTQDEDRCTVRDTTTAWNLSLFRSLAIFLFVAQSERRGGRKSLPDFELWVRRHPSTLIHRFMSG
jgi:predicted transposase YbfD/YdcC